MTGSCPVSAHVCRETARERDELRATVERVRDLADEWDRDAREHLTQFGQHMHASLEILEGQLRRALDGDGGA